MLSSYFFGVMVTDEALQLDMKYSHNIYAIITYIVLCIVLWAVANTYLVYGANDSLTALTTGYFITSWKKSANSEPFKANKLQQTVLMEMTDPRTIAKHLSFQDNHSTSTSVS
jgi:hypothetical protein